MRIYLKDPRRLHKTELQAVWDVSFNALEQDSRVFMGVIPFLVSDNIAQEFFEITDDDNLSEDFRLCTGGFGYVSALLRSSPDLSNSISEAIEPLLTLALIKRDKDARIFSCHGIVQMQFRYFLPPEERQQAFDYAVELVYHAFPKQSGTTNKNQVYQDWMRCNGYLQHVLSLKGNFMEERKHSKKFRAPSLFCELLKDCQR